MKNFIQDLFKKCRRREKQIFLFSNIVILVVVMAVVWGSYDMDNGTLTFPPSIHVNAETNPKPTDSTADTTAPTEDIVNIVEDSTDPTEIATEPTTNPTEVTESEWPKYHEVQKGDTWYSISKQYFGTDDFANVLAIDNSRKMTDYIFVGELLKIESAEYLDSLYEYTVNETPTEEYYTFYKGTFGYTYGQRPNPAIDITVSADCQGKNYTEEVDTSNFEFIGNHVITGYDPYCTHCCSGTGLMASGNYAVNGYSVAASYPIGTTLYIEGYGFYVVEDRGVSGKHIDIAAPSHDACYDITSNSVAVYIVPNNN